MDMSKAGGSSKVSSLEKTTEQSENPFAKLIPDQTIAIVPSFTLESGAALQNLPVAYTTRGRLSPRGDNALVICHALSGSADVADWWGPLLGGPGQAFDISKFFIVCLNSLGSPYGTASPVTNKYGEEAKGIYGPEFPLTTIRDDVRLHKIILDDLGVKQIAAVVGGSMGGMLCLEYAYFGLDYVRSIVPIATSAQHSAWGISWGEAQRQSIFSDPKYEDGYYDFGDPPITGLGAARMAALLTYRSRNSFETRFGRNTPNLSKQQSTRNGQPATPDNEHWSIHNHGHNANRTSRPPSTNNAPTLATFNNVSSTPQNPDIAPLPELTFNDPQFNGTTTFAAPIPIRVQKSSRLQSHYFSAQSYLRYQGTKFVKRFDSNCYIAITRKLDTHDVSRDRAPSVAEALAQIRQPALVLGIESDGLFTFAEQEELASGIKDSRLERIESPEGHDAFLLQFDQVNKFILEFFREVLPDIMAEETANGTPVAKAEIGNVTKSSTFGEAEAEDMLDAW
ncbi:MAG: hypothetical protein Q9227_004407 [Pyrenula ochraceoflavens]